jgi:hypothetical protein
MNTDTVIAASTGLCMLNWRAISIPAGATIDDETGLIKVNADTIKVAPHFLL